MKKPERYPIVAAKKITWYFAVIVDLYKPIHSYTVVWSEDPSYDRIFTIFAGVLV